MLIYHSTSFRSHKVHRNSHRHYYPVMLRLVQSLARFKGMRYKAVATILLVVAVGGAVINYLAPRRSVLPPAQSAPSLVMDTGHDGFITSVSFTKDGNYLVTAGGTKIVIWDVPSGRQLRSFTQGEGRSVALSPVDSILAATDQDTVVIENILTGEIVHTFPLGTPVITSLEFSPDGQFVACGTTNSERKRAIVKIVNIKDGTINPLYADSKWIYSLAFSPDGSLIAAGGESKVFMWVRSTGARYDLDANGPGSIESLTFSPDGKSLIAANGSSGVYTWDVSTRDLVQVLTGNLETISTAKFSPDGQHIILGEGSTKDEKKLKSIQIIDASTGAEIKEFASHQHPIRHLSVSPDGAHLATVSPDEPIKLWNLQSSVEARAIGPRLGKMHSISFSPDGKTLACAVDGNLNQPATIKLWDLAAGKEMRSLTNLPAGVSAMLFSPDSKQLVAGTSSGHLKIWDVESGAEKLSRSKLAKERVVAFHFDSSGTAIAAVSNDLALRIEDVSSGSVKKLLIPSEGKQRRLQINFTDENGRPFHSLSMLGGGISAAAFSPNGIKLATGISLGGGKTNRAIKIWDLTTGREQYTLPGMVSGITAVAFTSDGRMLATGSGGMGEPPPKNDETIKLWDAEKGIELRTFIGDAFGSNPLAFRASDDVNALAFSPDDKILASGSGSLLGSGSGPYSVTLWEVASGKEIKSIELDTPCETLAFSPDGKILATGNEGAGISFWEVTSGKKLVSLFSFGPTDWLAVSPDGLFDGTPTAWNHIQWRFSKELTDIAPVELYFREFFYPGLLPEVFLDEIPKAGQVLQTLDRRQPELKLSLAQEQAGEATITARHVRLQIKASEAVGDTRAGLRDGGIRDLRVFRNGSLVHEIRGDLTLNQHQTQVEVTIPIVAGRNLFTAYAFNHDNIKSTDATLIVNGGENLRRLPTLYILAIGVNEYSNSAFNLKYAVADSIEFSAEIQRQEQNVGQFDRVVTKALNNQEASKTNILTELAHLAEQSQPEDVVMVFFAGHGTAQKERFYLVPHDLGYEGKYDPAQIMASMQTILAHSISAEELETAFQKIDGSQFLLVIDACNSGQALEGEEKRRGPMNSKGLAQLAYDKGMYILTAAQSFQAALEDTRLQHGYLTYALINEGLEEFKSDLAPVDGRILIREWLNYASSRVPQMVIEKVAADRLLNLETSTKGPDRAVQTPRVFYRRESEPNMLLIAQSKDYAKVKH